jgi:hypothetical protein
MPPPEEPYHKHMFSTYNGTALQQPHLVGHLGPGIQGLIVWTRKRVPTGLYEHGEIPPKSPFIKGGLFKTFRQIPLFYKGGSGGISFRVQENKSNLLDAATNNFGAAL